jgi:hypothetical protein
MHLGGASVQSVMVIKAHSMGYLVGTWRALWIFEEICDRLCGYGRHLYSSSRYCPGAVRYLTQRAHFHHPSTGASFHATSIVATAFEAMDAIRSHGTCMDIIVVVPDHDYYWVICTEA